MISQDYWNFFLSHYERLYEDFAKKNKIKKNRAVTIPPKISIQKIKKIT